MKRKKKLNALDRYVIFSIAVLLIYTVTVLVLAVLGMAVPDNLTDNLYRAFGGEFLLAALIKIFKIVRGEEKAVG